MAKIISFPTLCNLTEHEIVAPQWLLKFKGGYRYERA
jgi:hypothetical protein